MKLKILLLLGCVLSLEAYSQKLPSKKNILLPLQRANA